MLSCHLYAGDRLRGQNLEVILYTFQHLAKKPGAATEKSELAKDILLNAFIGFVAIL